MSLLQVVIVAASTSLTLFGTLDGAATSALRDAAEIAGHGRIEYAGAIFKCGDRFTHSAPAKGAEGEFRVEVLVPKGCSLAGIFHTHQPGRRGDSSCFSQHDADVAAELGVPSYIVNVQDGTVHVLKDPPRRVGKCTSGKRLYGARL